MSLGQACPWLQVLKLVGLAMMRLDFGTCLWMFQVSFGASKRGSSDFKLSTLKIVVEKSSPTPFPSKQFWKFLRKKRMKNKFRAKRVRFEIRLKKRFVFKFSSRVRTLLLLLAEFFFRELSFSSDFASSSKLDSTSAGQKRHRSSFGNEP